MLRKLPGAAEAAKFYHGDPDADFHAIVAQMTGLSREDAKAVNFAKVFGAGVKKFAEMIGKPLREAQAIYEQYDRKLPFVRRLSNIIQNEAKMKGYTVLHDGARRHWNYYEALDVFVKGAGPCPIEEAKRRTADPGHPWYKHYLRRSKTHTSLNALIQGSAARHTKLWMRACWKEGVVPLLQMHDCLDCSVSSPDQAELVARLGCEAVQLTVPMRVDLKFGRTWGDASHSWQELNGAASTTADPTSTTTSTTTMPANGSADDVNPKPETKPYLKPLEEIEARIQATESELAQKFNQIFVLLGDNELTDDADDTKLAEADELIQYVDNSLERWVEGDTTEGENFPAELRQMLDQYSEIWRRREAAKEDLRSAKAGIETRKSERRVAREKAKATPQEGADEFPAAATLQAAEPSPSEPVHVCAQCRLDPPDGNEQPSAYNGLWLHVHCEDVFIRTRMTEEGLTESTAPDKEQAPPPPPPPPHDETPPPPKKDGPPPRGNGHGYPWGEREIGHKVAEYIYRDMKGAPYLKVAKYITKQGRKSYPQYHLENGSWMKGKPDGPAIPYRLPELLAAPPGAAVWIPEGELCADALAALGLVATTNPEGAGKWTPELNKWLAGFQVAYVLEDNDTAGRDHAAKVAISLNGTIPDIHVLTFRELSEHGDVKDWIDSGGTLKQLLERARQAPKFAALECVCAADEEIEALDWIWPGRFALGKIGLLVGLPDEGKGLAFSDIMARITRGSPWPCDEGHASLGNVILLTAEDDINDTIIPRLAAAGADLARVTIVKMMHEAGKQRMFSLISAHCGRKSSRSAASR
jgi:hypothetical protein